MRNKTSGKSGTGNGKAGRKLAELAPRQVKGGEATTLKGGALQAYLHVTGKKQG